MEKHEVRNIMEIRYDNLRKIKQSIIRKRLNKELRKTIINSKNQGCKMKDNNWGKYTNSDKTE
jgi:hypothetical protein